MKKTTLITCAILMAFSFTGCGATTTLPSDTEISTADTTQLPNPWYDYASLEEASQAAGYSITLPSVEAIEGETFYRVLEPGSDNPTLEIIYNNTDGEEELRIRKAPGSDDISGDYNIYTQTETVLEGSQNITFQGNDDTFYLATWSVDGYTYSVSSSAGLSQDAFTELVTQIN